MATITTQPSWKSAIPLITVAPLTTIFTPPEWCQNSFYTYHPLDTKSPGPSYFLRAQAANNIQAFDPKYSACYPPNFEYINSLHTKSPSQSRGLWSPGVCPSGWTSYTVSTSTNIYACCPDGFEWIDWQACKSRGTTKTIMALNDKKNTTVTPPYSLLDWPLIMAWATSDFDQFTPASAPLPSVFKEATDKDGSSGGLSTGAMAGIGSGVGVACIALIALLVFLLVFRRKHRKRQLAEIDQNRNSYDSRLSKPPPGYESPRSPLMTAPKFASSGAQSPAPQSPGPQSPGAVSELSSEKIPSQTVTPRPTSLPQNSSELEVPTVASGVTARELDSRQVYEAYGYPITPQKYAISNDELGELGLAPIAGRRGYQGAVRRGPSSASAASMYSEDDAANRSGEPSSIPGSTMAGRWADNPSYGTGTAI